MLNLIQIQIKTKTTDAFYFNQLISGRKELIAKRSDDRKREKRFFARSCSQEHHLGGENTEAAF